jgi:hypothetical protein
VYEPLVRTTVRRADTDEVEHLVSVVSPWYWRMEGLTGLAAGIGLILVIHRWRVLPRIQTPARRWLRILRYGFGMGALAALAIGGVWSWVEQPSVRGSVPERLGSVAMVAGLGVALCWLAEFTVGLATDRHRLVAPLADVGEQTPSAAVRPDDPGWSSWRRGVALGRDRAKRVDLLISLRAGFVMNGIVLGVLALVVISMPARARGTGALTIMIVAAGTAGLAGALSRRSSELPVGGTREVALGFRTLTMRATIYSWSGALAGLAGSTITGLTGPFILGATFTVAGLLSVAPTRAEIARRQSALDRSGFDVDLLSLLTSTPAG